MIIEKNPRDDGEYLNSLARGLAVMRSFSRERPGMTLSELATHTQLNPAVVRRCLNTLMHLGYVTKKGKIFLLRPEVFSLGAAYIESMNLEEVVTPSLQRVRDALQASSPDQSTIADLAYAWGFNHLGRFAQLYRKRFGELPSQTLRL